LASKTSLDEIPKHYAKCPLHTVGNARAFAYKRDSKKLFTLKEGRTLNFILHEALRPSNL